VIIYYLLYQDYYVEFKIIINAAIDSLIVVMIDSILYFSLD